LNCYNHNKSANQEQGFDFETVFFLFQNLIFIGDGLMVQHLFCIWAQDTFASPLFDVSKSFSSFLLFD